MRRIAILLLLWIAGMLLQACADDRYVVKTPVPPEPPKSNLAPRAPR